MGSPKLSSCWSATNPTSSRSDKSKYKTFKLLSIKKNASTYKPQLSPGTMSKRPLLHWSNVSISLYRGLKKALEKLENSKEEFLRDKIEKKHLLPLKKIKTERPNPNIKNASEKEEKLLWKLNHFDICLIINLIMYSLEQI